MRDFIMTFCLSAAMASAGCKGVADSSSGRDASSLSDGGSSDGISLDAAAGGDTGPALDSATADSAPPPVDAGSPSGLDEDDMELFNLVNDYRVSRGLAAIPLSPSLSLVARTHVEDLISHGANSGPCNLHSWSDEGSWSGCCYTSDHAQASCMWSKPRELTDYPGNGYEISASGVSDAARALALWQGSPGHHDVMINAGSWSQPWRAMGVAITPGSYAHIWFGREADPGL